MEVAQCEIDGLVFGFTAEGQIVLPAEVAKLDHERRFYIVECAVGAAAHMQYHASMLSCSDVEIHLDVFGRGAIWRDQFINEEITRFVNNPKIFSAFPSGRAQEIRDIVEYQWGCDYTKLPWGFVYLLKSAPFGYYKIGFTTNPQSRLHNFGVKLPFMVECLCLIPHQRARAVEAELHKRYDSKRVDGEWFELTDAEVADIVNTKPGGVG